MRFSSMKSAFVAAVVVAVSPALGLGAATDESPIVFVADSRGLTGWRALCTNLYNESLFQFAVLTVILIPVLAVILGSIVNFFLVRSGIDLKSRTLAEH
jgi:hypothetical protein